MAPTDSEHVLLDTNILLAATDEGRSDHHLAVDALNAWPSRGITCYTSGQILREYLAAASRPIAVDGLGLSQTQCLGNVAALRGRLRFLAETERVFDQHIKLLGAVPCLGKQAHDASLVATALVHGVPVIATQNVGDFARFAGHVEVRSLD